MIAQGEKDKKPVGTREWYDFVGQLADVIPEMHPGGQEASKALVEMCGINAESRVLDIGCGSGHTACLIAEGYGSQVYGIDISERMIVKAKERAGRKGLSERLDFRIADVFDLPFDDDWFDCVIIESVLTPLPGDKNKAMREIVRVVKPGGRVGANEGIVDPSTPPEFLALLEQHPAFHGYFTPETLRDLFEKSGLEVVGMKETTEVDLPRPRMGLRSLLRFMVRDYPRLVWRLVRDSQIREARKIDDELTKLGSEYMGHALVVGQKPG